VNVRGGWGWYRARHRTVAVVYVRPVYAPALVAWGRPDPQLRRRRCVGGGTGVNVGWFPLGPREVYVPSYHSSRTYINNVNVSNTTVNQTVVNNYYNTTVINKNVTNVTYVNQRVAGGVTATSGQSFSSAQPVARNMVRVDQREVATAQVAVRGPSVVPPKQAVSWWRRRRPLSAARCGPGACGRREDASSARSVAVCAASGSYQSQ